HPRAGPHSHARASRPRGGGAPDRAARLPALSHCITHCITDSARRAVPPTGDDGPIAPSRRKEHIMATTITPTSRRKTGPTPLAKGLVLALLLVAAFFATKQFAPGLFGGHKGASAPATVPPKAELPQGGSAAPAMTLASTVPTIAPPTSSEPGCTDKPEVRM